MYYELACDKGHTQSVAVDEIERLIDDLPPRCQECSRSMELRPPPSLILECCVCSMVFEVGSLEEALNTIQLGCGKCGEYLDGRTIFVQGSLGQRKAEFFWSRSQKEPKPLRVDNRNDYWEGVVHFCNADEFAAIHRDAKIRASSTGYFGAPAVCLSETPNSDWTDIRARHGQYGYVFMKRDIIAAGGGPALYMSDHLLRRQKALGVADEVKPFVNLLTIPSVNPGKAKHDFIHEREWRVPGDIDLAVVKPWGVVLQDLPEHSPTWDIVLDAAIEYEEIEVPRRS